MALSMMATTQSNPSGVILHSATARDSLLETLKGKRFAMGDFDDEESKALRLATDSVGAHMHVIAEDPRHPGLNSLSPFDACVINLSSSGGKVAGGLLELVGTHNKPTIIIGDRAEILGHAFIVGSSNHQFIIRPWTREDFYLRAFVALRDVPDIIVTSNHEAVVRTEPTILVADDDRTTVMMVRSILRTWKANCAVAQTGKETLEMTKRIRPDALLLDVSMPDMNGFEVLRALRADPATRATPIVMLTAAQSENDIVRGFELGADDYITKPFRAHEMLARLKRLLRIRADA